MDIIVFLYVISCLCLVSFFYIKIKQIECIEKNDEKEKKLKKLLKKSLIILLIFFIFSVIFTVLRFNGSVKNGNIKILSIFSILSFLALLGNISTIVSEKRKAKGYKFDTDVMKYLKRNLVELKKEKDKKKKLKNKSKNKK